MKGKRLILLILCGVVVFVGSGYGESWSFGKFAREINFAEIGSIRPATVSVEVSYISTDPRKSLPVLKFLFGLFGDNPIFVSSLEDYLFAGRKHSSVNMTLLLAKDGGLWRKFDAVSDLKFIPKIHKLDGCVSKVTQTTNSEVIAIRHGLLMERFNPVYKQPPAFYVHRDVCLLIKNSSLLSKNSTLNTNHYDLKQAHEHQRPSEDDVPPIGRRFTFLFLFGFGGLFISLWGFCLFDNQRRLYGTSLIVGGWILSFVGLAQWFLMGFQQTWGWWI